MRASNEKPGEEVCIGELVLAEGYVCCLAITTIFKGLGGANR